MTTDRFTDAAVERLVHAKTDPLPMGPGQWQGLPMQNGPPSSLAPPAPPSSDGMRRTSYKEDE